MSVELSFYPLTGPLPVIGREEIHLWRARLNYSAERNRRFENVLSNEESQRARRYHFLEDRRRYTAGRGLLRIVLGRYLGPSPAEVRLVTGAHGKPELEGSHPSAIAFSVSHTKTLALFAMALGRGVGVDLEAIHPLDEAEDILRRFFTIKEQEAYAQAPASERDRLFLELWTRREAYLKGIGKGLAGMDGPDRIYSPASDWELLSFRIDTGHVAALACEGEIGKLSTWEIPASWIIPQAA
jgi:4'-phosphopantetheinyl transferase